VIFGWIATKSVGGKKNRFHKLVVQRIEKICPKTLSQMQSPHCCILKLLFFQISPEEGSMHSLKVSTQVLREIYQLQEK